MDDLCETMLRGKLEVVGTDLKALFIDAMILRCDVHMIIASNNGAEAEDVPEIIARAIETAMPLVQNVIDVLSEKDKLNDLQRRIKP